MINAANIVFFSGTGCTARSAKALRNSLQKIGVPTFVEELRGRQDSTPQVNADMLIIMYPVYTFDAPLPIYEYVGRLKAVDKQSVALVPVSGGGDISPNRACRLGIRTELEQKGFTVVYESMIVMPCNVIVYTPDPVAVALLKKLPVKCDEIASDLARGISSRKDPPLVDRLFSKVGEWEKGYWGRIRFSEKIHVSDACISCGLCARSCPRRNIDMIDGTPRFRADCVMCLNCIYVCPSNALSAGYGSFLVLKNGFSLDSYEDESNINMDELTSLIKGALWKGVKQYLFD